MENILIKENRFHPLRFALWLAIASIIMLFAALTSAYIVRRDQGDWQTFHLPAIFWFNTLIIIASSITMQWTLNQFKLYKERNYRLGLLVTLILGTTFLAGQYAGWMQLGKEGIYLSGNPAGSFVYVISGIHGAHILGGLIIMFLIYIKAVSKPFNPGKLLNVQLMTTYWHFVDVLWIYLFVFFQINQV
jgi:cytochrome c oxidase subunit III